MAGNKEYIFFWGCTIPGRLPFLEKSLRLVLKEMGVSYRETDGFTCCPEKFLIETMSEHEWYLTAARNLALAEERGCDLLVACNGCYSTFLTAISGFNQSSKLRAGIKDHLGSIGVEYNFRASAKHLVELLHDEIGTHAIRKKAVRGMEGLNIAVHYGCQFLRPSPASRIDDAGRAQKLDALVECLGATSIDYLSKEDCCGETLGRSGFPSDSLDSVRAKLTELQQLGVDALVVICPACFQQFDGQQYYLRKQGEEFDIPILYYSEILGLSLGISGEDMGLNMHRVPTDRFFSRWDEEVTRRQSVPEGFDVEELEQCIKCGSCAYDCPVTQVEDEYEPHSLLQMILDGRIEELMRSDYIWMCMECGTCRELCPNNLGMMKPLKRVKGMAMERGIMPADTERGIEMFNKTATIGKTREMARKKLGLGPVAESGKEQLKELLHKAGEKDEEE